MSGRGRGLLPLGIVGLAGVAALRRGLELRAERSGRLARLGPDRVGDVPRRGLGALVAGWQPAPPGTSRGRLVATAWAAPATVVGLAMAGLGGGRVAWDGDVGAWVATGVGGPSGWLLRRAGLAANTLGHAVVCIHDDVGRRLLDHEGVHVRQFERLGVGMYPLYLWLSARHGYRDNPLEVAARRGAARRAARRHPLDPHGLGPGPSDDDATR